MEHMTQKLVDILQEVNHIDTLDNFCCFRSNGGPVQLGGQYSISKSMSHPSLECLHVRVRVDGLAMGRIFNCFDQESSNPNPDFYSHQRPGGKKSVYRDQWGISLGP
jgi:hypothetical protein